MVGIKTIHHGIVSVRNCFTINQDGINSVEGIAIYSEEEKCLAIIRGFCEDDVNNDPSSNGRSDWILFGLKNHLYMKKEYYKEDNKGWCSTPCEHLEVSSLSRPQIGSIWCQECRYFNSKDLDKRGHYVRCNFSDKMQIFERLTNK